MWQLAVAAGLKTAAPIVSGLIQRGRIKQAGTVLQQRAEGKAEEALARAREVNPYLQESYLKAQHGIEATAFPQADIVEERAERAGQEAIGAAREGIGYLDPYRTAGTEAVSTLSEMGRAKAPTAADLEIDPGYQFRLAEGAKALERSAAARGGLLGGGTLRALTRYSQSEASQEYANMFDRFMKQQEARRQSLSQLANLGSSAATKAGEFLTGATEYAGTRGTEATRFGAGMRTGAAERVGNLGIESTRAQIDELRYADAIARGAWDEAAQIRAESMMGAGQATAGMWSGAMQGAGSGFETWAAYSQPRSSPGGGARYPSTPTWNPPYADPWDPGSDWWRTGRPT